MAGGYSNARVHGMVVEVLHVVRDETHTYMIGYVPKCGKHAP